MGIHYWLRALTASKEELDVLRLMKRTPKSSIEKLGELEVRRITGVVAPLDDYRVPAPITNRQVLGWGYSLDSIEIQARRHEVLPFALIEDGHRARIDVGPSCRYRLFDWSANVRFLIAPSKYRRISGRWPPEMLDVLRNAGASGGTYHFEEWVIEPGMRLSVVGAGVREPDPAPGAVGTYRERPTWVMLTGTPDTPIALTDAVKV